MAPGTLPTRRDIESFQEQTWQFEFGVIKALVAGVISGAMLHARVSMSNQILFFYL